jgi:hypothetical protein
MRTEWKFILFLVFLCQLFWLGRITTKRELYAEAFAQAEMPLSGANEVSKRVQSSNIAYILKMRDTYRNTYNDSLRAFALRYEDAAIGSTMYNSQFIDTIRSITMSIMPDSVEVFVAKAQKLEAIQHLTPSDFEEMPSFERLRHQLDTFYRLRSVIRFSNGLKERCYGEDIIFDTMMLVVEPQPNMPKSGEDWSGVLNFCHFSAITNNVTFKLDNKKVPNTYGATMGYLIAQPNGKQIELEALVKNPLTGEVMNFRRVIQLPFIQK